MMANESRFFQNACVIETGFSYFRRMTVFILKMHFRKLSPKNLSATEIFKSLKMKGLWIPYLALNGQNIDYTKNPDLFLKHDHNHHAPRKIVHPWE